MAKPGEFEIIEMYFAPLSGDGSFNLKDDAAELVASAGHSIVITQDALAEGIHYFADDPPDLIAKKAVRTNLSDLAAKGATPKSLSLALGLGTGWNEDWVAGFAKGLAEDCQRFGVCLSGGDTFQTGAGSVISICAVGETPTGKYVSRLGASSGDLLYVTGWIGDGSLGLLARQGKLAGLEQHHVDYLCSRYLVPEPRVELADCLRNLASAAMDISDGLIGDLDKLLTASSAATELKLADIPLSGAGRACIGIGSEYLQTAVTGGDDYEILFTVHPDKAEVLKEVAKSLSFPLTQIGVIGAGKSITVFDIDGSVMEFNSTSYNHSDS